LFSTTFIAIFATTVATGDKNKRGRRGGGEGVEKTKADHNLPNSTPPSTLFLLDEALDPEGERERRGGEEGKEGRREGSPFPTLPIPRFLLMTMSCELK